MINLIKNIYSNLVTINWIQINKDLLVKTIDLKTNEIIIFQYKNISIVELYDKFHNSIYAKYSNDEEGFKSILNNINEYVSCECCKSNIVLDLNLLMDESYWTYNNNSDYLTCQTCVELQSKNLLKLEIKNYKIYENN